MSARPLGLFDQEIRQRKLEALGDALVELNRIVPWEMFRETLEAMHPQRDPRKGGRPPHDAVRMFKVLVLRELFTLSDKQVEFQIADRLSFQRFLGIDLTQDAPDYTAIWRFRERLGPERMQALFAELNGYIDLAGFEARKGQMIDASIVQKPKTRQPAVAQDGAPLTRQQAAHRDGEANWNANTLADGLATRTTSTPMSSTASSATMP